MKRMIVCAAAAGAAAACRSHKEEVRSEQTATARRVVAVEKNDSLRVAARVWLDEPCIVVHRDSATAVVRAAGARVEVLAEGGTHAQTLVADTAATMAAVSTQKAEMQARGAPPLWGLAAVALCAILLISWIRTRLRK